MTELRPWSLQNQLLLFKDGLAIPQISKSSVGDQSRKFNKQVSHVNKMAAENSEIPFGGRDVCCLFLSPLWAGMWVWALKTHCICIRNWELAAWHTKYVEKEPRRLFCFFKPFNNDFSLLQPWFDEFSCLHSSLYCFGREHTADGQLRDQESKAGV